MKNENKLTIDFTGTRICYGKMLKDGMTISDTAKDITESNFLSTMLYYLECKTNNFEEDFEIRKKNGEVYTIRVTKTKKEDE